MTTFTSDSPRIFVHVLVLNPASKCAFPMFLSTIEKEHPAIFRGAFHTGVSILDGTSERELRVARLL